LILRRSLNWRLCHYPNKNRAILAKVAFLATIVTSVVTFQVRANTSQVRAFTLEALCPALL